VGGVSVGGGDEGVKVVELGGRVWYSVKSSILGTICLPEPKPLLSPFTSQSPYAFCGARPHFGEGVELGGQVEYPAKVLQFRHNLFAGTETLSLSVYEPITILIFYLGRRLILGKGRS